MSLHSFGVNSLASKAQPVVSRSAPIVLQSYVPTRRCVDVRSAAAIFAAAFRVGDAVCSEHAAHENHGAAAPDTGFQNVARNSVGQDGFHAVLNVVEALHPDHRMREFGVVPHRWNG